MVTLSQFPIVAKGAPLPSIEDLIASDGEVEVDSQAKGFYEKAIKKYKDSDINGAIHYAKLAYRKDQRVILLEDGGLISGIESYIKKEAINSPNDPTIFYGLAKILAIQNKTDETKKALEKIIEIDADSDLGRKAATILKNAPGSAPEKSSDSYEAEYAKLTAKSDQLSNENKAINKTIVEEEYAKDQQQELNSARDKRIAELTEQNRMDSLYSTLFWANPTNAWAMNNNYTRPTAGQIKQHPDYYKAKGAEAKARVEYRKGYAPSPGKPVHLPVVRR